MSLWLCLVNVALTVTLTQPLNADTNEGLTEGFTQRGPWISPLFLSLAVPPPPTRRCWLPGL